MHFDALRGPPAASSASRSREKRRLLSLAGNSRSMPDPAAGPPVKTRADAFLLTFSRHLLAPPPIHKTNGVPLSMPRVSPARLFNY